MTTTKDVKDQFIAVGPPVEGIIFSDSRVIPVENIQGGTFTIYDTVMKLMNPSKSPELKVVQELDTFGNEWAEQVETCALPLTDYGVVPTKGITNSQIVAYQDVANSSNQDMVFNELQLINSKRSNLMLTNNIQIEVEKAMQDRCADDILCASMYGLCMGESSQIFLCDKYNRATDVKWSPQADDLVTDMTLIG